MTKLFKGTGVFAILIAVNGFLYFPSILASKPSPAMHGGLFFILII